MTTADKKPNRERAQRQARARWAFYARLGGLKMIEGILKSLMADYRSKHIVNSCLELIDEVESLRVELIRVHERDWRQVK